MREIVKYDDRRHCEITLYLNDIDQITGCSVYFNTPVMFHNFSLQGVAMVAGCGTCSDKGLPISTSANIPDRSGKKCGKL
jgi:hypothetical protein